MENRTDDDGQEFFDDDFETGIDDSLMDVRRDSEKLKTKWRNSEGDMARKKLEEK
jgi:hypothetical protein